ncbi:MAG: thiamine diphosphokinase [Lachnospiraceae bacterium]|nr:thiamine diphosphokinase [Lachnospiraceae bacterium]
MKTLIISGGRIDVDFVLGVLEQPFDHIICADKGLAFCYKQEIRPTRIVGDFDSLQPEILEKYRHTDIELREFNPVKDATDTQITVELALELGSTDITIVGATGTRLDHVLGNIHTLYLPFEKGVSCRILDEYNRIRLISGDISLKREEQYGDFFSLIPFTEEVRGVTLQGVKYPLSDYDFTVRGSASRGISNEITEDVAQITIGEGIMILIESRDS